MTHRGAARSSDVAWASFLQPDARMSVGQRLAILFALATAARAGAIPQPPHDEATHGIRCLDCHAPYASLNDPARAEGVAGDGSSATTLVDSTKTWTPSEWVGGVVTITSGANLGQFRELAESGDTSVSWALPLPAPLAAGDGYRIGKTTQVDVETKCKSCHNPTGSASALGEVGLHRVHGGTTIVGCGKCHEPHNIEPNSGVGNGLIRWKVRWPSARPTTVFPSGGPNAFIAGAPAYNGICETCHTATQFHRNGATGDHDHNAGTTCTDCHTHKSGFEPAGCTKCHALPQGSRRPVVADFERTAHHVAGVVQDGDCVVCHDTTKHKQGTVRLKDPDDPAVVYAATDPASGTAFCAHCHDANGAAAHGGTTPFSDGATVPNVTAAWSASAHAQGALSCTACHGNGHGSNLKKLLKPWNGTPGPDNVNAEEGLCFGCHTDGGVSNEPISNGWFGATYTSAGASVQAAFGKHTSHPVVDSQPGHVFDLGFGPQELECTSCHNPHQDTGKYWAAPAGKSPVSLGGVWGNSPDEKIGMFDESHEYVAPSIGQPGPDLSGAPLPISPPSTSQLTAAAKPDYATLCLSCHEKALGSVAAVDWTTKQHGSAAAEPVTLGYPMKAPWDTSLRSRYYLDCLDCHEAHGSPNTRLIRTSANGQTMATITETTTKGWSTLCNTCHAVASRHHNDDVKTKSGKFQCAECHPHGAYLSCATSGCHAHKDFF